MSEKPKFPKISQNKSQIFLGFPELLTDTLHRRIKEIKIMGTKLNKQIEEANPRANHIEGLVPMRYCPRVIFLGVCRQIEKDSRTEHISSLAVVIDCPRVIFLGVCRQIEKAPGKCPISCLAVDIPLSRVIFLGACRSIGRVVSDLSTIVENQHTILSGRVQGKSRLHKSFFHRSVK